MTHAWLDSLSEDWPSQAGSEHSPPQLPALKHDENSIITNNDAKEPGSRIPLPVTKARHPSSNAHDSSVNVLSERSSNEKIGPSSVRIPSKLSQEIKISDKSRQASRTFSASTTGSVVHNTVQHNSPGTSPRKSHGQTPEWKKRLVYGEVAYGEQRDLFSSAAATGLENIFKPPTTQEVSRLEPVNEQDSILASSPPAHQPPVPEEPVWDESDEDEEVSLAQAHEGSPSPSPRRPQQMTYKLMDDSADQSDWSDLSMRPHSQGQGATTKESAPTAPTTLAPPDDVSRKTSGQSVVRNEDFSPIMMSCREGNNGQLDFAPEVPPNLLQQRLEKLRINQIRLQSYSEERLELGEQQQQGSDPAGIETTDDFAQQGGFLNLQRGGRSMEGSFKNRPLSPGFAVDTSEMLPEESLQASTPKQFPTLRIHEQGSQRFASQSPPQLRAPFPSPEKQGAPPQTNAGSPLKLFGPYDTFTNQTLLRRISQFEDHSSNSSRQSFGPTANIPALHSHQYVNSAGPSSRSVSQFGHGDLEGYQFDEDLSIHHQHGGHLVEGDGEGSSEMDASAPLSDRDASPLHEGRMSVPKRRQDSNVTPAGSRQSRSHSASSRGLASGAQLLSTPKRDAGSEGKRPRTSPSKDPTPKRRRTLHKSDVAYGRDQHPPSVESIQDTHFSMQSMMSRKRKEARPGGPQELAPPDVLSLRHIMRPRTPTPSQRSSVQRDRHPSNGEFPEEHQDSRHKSPMRASQFGTSIKEGSQFTENGRKPSIRTQDFVDQAGAIMAMIRSGAKPPSGLASVEESESENISPGFPADGSSCDESTREPFSRPPSRDGKPVERVPQRQENPEILDYLRKYREVSDMGDIISSVRSSVEAQDVAGTRGGQEQGGTMQGPYPSTLDGLLDDSDMVSDPPNIRISHGPASERNDVKAEFPSNSSNGSTGRSIPTGSSRGSDSRRTIAPQSVSHLIPDQVGSMYLDRDHNIWIKRKGGSMRVKNVLPSEDSEEDPFKSIPDLSVDMTREMQNLRLGASQRSVPGEEKSASSPASSGTPQSQQSKSYVTLSPNGSIPEDMASQARDELTKLESKINRANESRDVVQEMKVEDRINRNTPSKKNLTISFSSPIASIIHDMSMEDIDSLEDDAGVIPRPTTQPQSERGPRNRYPSLSRPNKKKMQNRSKSMPRGGARHFSVHGQAFVPRPVSRIDEQDEDNAEQKAYDESRQISIIGDTSLVNQTADNHHGSLSFILSTPGIPAEAAGGVISKNVGNMSLSPMSEFTMNNQDQSFGFEVSYIVDKQHLVTGDGSKRVLSLTVRDLVDRLTEVEPFEPNWEDFQDLDVSNKRLSSLHMLDEFCGRLVTLDASNNALAHLDGVPSTVRELKMTNNLLTEITSWDHLYNLQYIDVSNNELQSLAALSSLVHLRSVKADNNKLTSLDGLMFHDGLLSLRARDNLIETLDFDSNKLDRLAELDLSGNKISEISHLGQLGALETLKLQKNELTVFGSETPLQRLRYLDLGDNGLATLDITYMPGLRLLHADRNRLGKITGFTKARHLDSISLREQKGEDKLDLSFLSAAYEVRKLFLSGNYIGEFEPKVDFLNLQLLELANCGLHRLPQNLGQLMPNLRSLNLNFNALADVSAIRFIPRMKKLLMSGNRLADSTHVTTILTEFPHLTRLDLRDNPVTLGFYPPVQVMVPVDREGYVDPFVLPEADAERDEQFRGRLDEATKLRRRLYQMVFVGCCKRLRVLDGLGLDRKAVLARDAAFDKLVGEGLLPHGADAKTQRSAREEKSGNDVADSSRWNAEDSFA